VAEDSGGRLKFDRTPSNLSKRGRRKDEGPIW